MNKLRQSLRRKKPTYVPEASRPHQWQADEEAVRKGKCNFPVRVSSQSGCSTGREQYNLILLQRQYFPISFQYDWHNPDKHYHFVQLRFAIVKKGTRNNILLIKTFNDSTKQSKFLKVMSVSNLPVAGEE